MSYRLGSMISLFSKTLLKPSSTVIALPKPLLPSLRFFSTTSIWNSSPRTKVQHGSGKKLKSHSGVKKRFFPLGSGSGKAYQVSFKRAFTGKRHLNSHMDRGRLGRLGGTTIVPRGKVNKTVRRLLAACL